MSNGVAVFSGVVQENKCIGFCLNPNHVNNDTYDEMHRAKRKSTTQGVLAPKTSDNLRKSGETLTRMRFQNKKPLCLQYNLTTNSFGLKSQFRRSRQCKFIALNPEQNNAHIINFLLKPATYEVSRNGFSGSRSIDEVQYKRYMQKKCPTNLLYKLSSSKKYCNFPLSRSTVRSSVKASLPKRDYGRSLRLAQQMDRFAELYVF
uniref:Reverse transcriptase domain-containing protein n=1 Tax=Syphacia muris TaxID=451379 RepID=A0A0N5AK82_9BILA